MKKLCIIILLLALVRSVFANGCENIYIQQDGKTYSICIEDMKEIKDIQEEIENLEFMIEQYEEGIINYRRWIEEYKKSIKQLEEILAKQSKQ